MNEKFNLFCAIVSGVCLLNSGAYAQDCESKETCDQCIQEFGCLWCSNPKNGAAHCLNTSSTGLCSVTKAGDLENPKPSFEILQQNKLTDREQIIPQKIALRLRRNDKYEIQFRYKQSANYPVDLYYLMDLSHSMKESKKDLAQLGGALVAEMKKKTNNFQIGFGSFVDKLTLPYVNTHPHILEHPCNGCSPPYSFKNHLSLINDAELFSNEVNKTQMSGNLDTPEGGLDAIMQAMVCKKEIGWRPNARHLLVMSTDAVSHIAGDGKLGGVIEPNDATCHMVDNSYTHALTYDYPSVSQINYVARENNINIIFAIVNANDDLKSHYEGMSKVIENSKTGHLTTNSNTGKPTTNSDNVVKFISDIYDEIRDSVKITSNVDKDVNVNITADCPGFKEASCSVKPGQTLSFKAVITPLTCHKNPQLNKKTIKIKPEGLQDSLVIDLEVICDCDCAASKRTADSHCSNEGDLECGICRCNEGRFGAQCQCDHTNSISEDPRQCIKPGGKNETCSGQGKCKCGKCECKPRPGDEKIYGKYCECDNFSCYLQCSNRGVCDCGKCNCENGWTGPGCECSTDRRECSLPGKKECSGHGECICGQCQCSSEGDKRYSGKYCEECTNCPAQRCDELKPCVECQVYQTGIYANKTECKEKCPIFTLNTVQKLDEVTNEGTKRCRVLVEKDCTIVFDYSYDEAKNLVVTAEEKQICNEPPPLFVLVLSVIASVLLIGIITLIIWKIVTTVHDKNEYARFLNERTKTQWDVGENPLYKPGTSHFQNPTYQRASHRVSTAPTSNKIEPKSSAD